MQMLSQLVGISVEGSLFRAYIGPIGSHACDTTRGVQRIGVIISDFRRCGRGDGWGYGRSYVGWFIVVVGKVLGYDGVASVLCLQIMRGRRRFSKKSAVLSGVGFFHSRGGSSYRRCGVNVGIRLYI